MSPHIIAALISMTGKDPVPKPLFQFIFDPVPHLLFSFRVRQFYNAPVQFPEGDNTDEQGVLLPEPVLPVNPVVAENRGT